MATAESLPGQRALPLAEGVPTPDTSTALTSAESKQLTAAEQTIERGRKAFVEVGNALAAIRDGKLYRATHGTFEVYCKERWDFGRAYASRLIGAAETMQLLPIGNTLPSRDLPSCEAQVRPLLQFKAEERAKVWGDLISKQWRNADGSWAGTARNIERQIKLWVRGSSDEPYRSRRLELRREKREKREEMRSGGVASTPGADNVKRTRTYMLVRPVGGNETGGTLVPVPSNEKVLPDSQIADVFPEVAEGLVEDTEPSFSKDLDALIAGHRKHETPWCIICSVLENTLERARQERD